MRYEHFIADLRRSISDGQKMLTGHTTHRDQEFREWRHRIESSVKDATASGYRLPGPVKSPARTYRSVYEHSAGTTEFERDVEDTLIELRFLVERYEQQGAPPLVKPPVAASASRPSAAALQLPDRVTVSWLMKHVPAGIWIKAAGVLAVAFVLGAATYRSGLYAPLETWIKSTLD